MLLHLLTARFLHSRAAATRLREVRLSTKFVAFDPEWTFCRQFCCDAQRSSAFSFVVECGPPPEGAHEATRLYRSIRQRSGCVAARGAGAASSCTSGRLSSPYIARGPCGRACEWVSAGLDRHRICRRPKRHNRIPL